MTKNGTMPTMGRPLTTKKLPGLAPLLEDCNVSRVAARAGVSRSLMHYLRQQKRGANPETVEKLANYFRVTPDQLLNSANLGSR